jgi:hypothetical protein
LVTFCTTKEMLLSDVEVSMPIMTMISSDQLLGDDPFLDARPSGPVGGRVLLVLSPPDGGARPGWDVGTTDVDPVVSGGGSGVPGRSPHRADPSSGWCA